jgi:hypothetical protein
VEPNTVDMEQTATRILTRKYMSRKRERRYHQSRGLDRASERPSSPRRIGVRPHFWFVMRRSKTYNYQRNTRSFAPDAASEQRRCAFLC